MVAGFEEPCLFSNTGGLQLGQTAGRLPRHCFPTGSQGINCSLANGHLWMKAAAAAGHTLAELWFLQPSLGTSRVTGFVRLLVPEVHQRSFKLTMSLWTLALLAAAVGFLLHPSNASPLDLVLPSVRGLGLNGGQRSVVIDHLARAHALK